jgi:pyruvate-ferredoxin/flavodoxin oxidoreductase
MQNQKAAVNSGQWLLYRYNPDRVALGENPLQLDSPPPKKPISDYFQLENRFKMLNHSHPAVAAQLLARVQEDTKVRREVYDFLATRKFIPNQPYL